VRRTLVAVVVLLVVNAGSSRGQTNDRGPLTTGWLEIAGGPASTGNGAGAISGWLGGDGWVVGARRSGTSLGHVDGYTARTEWSALIGVQSRSGRMRGLLAAGIASTGGDTLFQVQLPSEVAPSFHAAGSISLSRYFGVGASLFGVAGDHVHFWAAAFAIQIGVLH
jgi:hypothetical protein